MKNIPSIQLQPFSKLLEKATTILGISTAGSFRAPALDGEIVYSKNNVCVHQAITNKPVPGYFSLRCSTAETVSEELVASRGVVVLLVLLLLLPCEVGFWVIDCRGASECDLALWVEAETEID